MNRPSAAGSSGSDRSRPPWSANATVTSPLRGDHTVNRTPPSGNTVAPRERRQREGRGLDTSGGILQAALPQTGESPEDDGESGESPQDGEAKLDCVGGAAESRQEIDGTENEVCREHQPHQDDDLTPETFPHAVSSAR